MRMNSQRAERFLRAVQATYDLSVEQEAVNQLVELITAEVEAVVSAIPPEAVACLDSWELMEWTTRVQIGYSRQPLARPIRVPSFFTSDAVHAKWATAALRDLVQHYGAASMKLTRKKTEPYRLLQEMTVAEAVERWPFLKGVK